MKVNVNKPQCNTELLVSMMEFSKVGPLIQGFIMTGLREYADQVAAKKPEDLDSPFVSGAAWHAAAVEVQQKMDAFYSRHDDRPAE